MLHWDGLLVIGVELGSALAPTNVDIGAQAVPSSGEAQCLTERLQENRSDSIELMPIF